jgi:hypothetical protein
MCEASGAVALPETAFENLFVVANDEDNTLRVYAAGKSGGPLAERDLGEFLGLDVSSDDDDKADIEAAAWLAGRIYWIGSHSRSGRGRLREQRQQFFATVPLTAGEGVPPNVAVVRGTRSRSLTEALSNMHFGLAAAIGEKERDRDLAPERRGLNIEGLASRPNGTSLLIALRNPLRSGQAIFIPFLNPNSVVDGTEEPRLAEPVSVDLGGRGVRSVEYSAARNAYIIVAGPTGDAAPVAENIARFAFYSWSGRPEDPAMYLASATDALRKLEADWFQPEALIVDPSGVQARLLSDDGDRRLPGGMQCREVGRSDRRFRSVVLNLD